LAGWGISLKTRAVQTHFKNLGFLGYFKKPKEHEKLGFQIFRFFGFSSQNLYIFMSNSVNLFEFIGVAIFVTFNRNIAMHELIFV